MHGISYNGIFRLRDENKELRYSQCVFKAKCTKTLDLEFSIPYDVILGLNFQAQCKSGTFDYGGDKPSSTVCG